MRRIVEIRKFSKPTGRILDIGCHAGFLTKAIIQGYPKIDLFGIDVSHQAIAKAKKRIPSGHFRVANALRLPYKSNFFTNIYCIEMLEHTEKPENVLCEIKRVLKKNGEAVILVPNDSLLFKTIWKLWNMIYPVWKDAHVQSFNEKSLKKILRTAGLKTTQTKKFNLNMLLLVKAVKV